MKTKTFILSIFLCFIALLNIKVYALDGLTIQVFKNIKGILINGKEIVCKEEPFVYNNRTYVPLRIVAEELGFQVNYDEVNKTINIIDTKITKVYPRLYDIKEYLCDDDWNEFKGGCSWYCAAKVPKLSASSELENNGDVNYKVQNVHDFNLNTVWVEGAEGYGIGETIEMIVEGNQIGLAITHIEIINGYVKSNKMWEENTRVKTLMLKKDGQPYKVLLLEDSKDVQSFEIGYIGIGGKEDIVLDFEIMDVYPGSKYKDTAITELELDGIGDH